MSRCAAGPIYTWPDGKRLAVYFALNLEHFSFGEGLGAELCAGRAAARRAELRLARLRQPRRRLAHARRLRRAASCRWPRWSTPALYDYAPELVAAFRARGDEIVGHGRTNAERQGSLDEAAERALIAEATARITKEEGRAPEGWLGPWISESHRTPDLLAEAGYALSARLVHGRPADLVPLPRRPAHPRRALSAGGERHPGDRRAQDGRGGVRRHDRRPVRRDAGTSPRRGRWSWASRCTPTSSASRTA